MAWDHIKGLAEDQVDDNRCSSFVYWCHHSIEGHQIYLSPHLWLDFPRNYLISRKFCDGRKTKPRCQEDSLPQASLLVPPYPPSKWLLHHVFPAFKPWAIKQWLQAVTVQELCCWCTGRAEPRSSWGLPHAQSQIRRPQWSLLRLASRDLWKRSFKPRWRAESLEHHLESSEYLEILTFNIGIWGCEKSISGDFFV